MKQKQPLVEEEEKTLTDESAEIMAQLADLTSKRKTHIKNSDDFEAQVLEMDIKLLKLELEKIDIRGKRDQIVHAKKLAEARRKEGKGND